MMIDIITKQNRPFFRSELEEMHRMRYRVAVEEWGWDIPDIPNGYDKDQFDRDDTVYVLGYDDNGRVKGCGRIVRTDRPHLLSEIFPHQCEFAGVPSAENIFEFSRFIIDGDGLSQHEKLQLSLKISLAVTEYCFDQNASHLTFLAYKETYTKGVVLWKSRPLGLPRYYEDDDATYVAGIGEVSASAIKRISRFARVKGRVGQYRRLPADQTRAA